MERSLPGEQDDLVYGSDGFPLDVLPASWFDGERQLTTVEPELEPIPDDRLLDVNAAATYVGVHANTIYDAAKRGALRCRRVGRLRRFTVEDLDIWTRGAR